MINFLTCFTVSTCKFTLLLHIRTQLLTISVTLPHGTVRYDVTTLTQIRRDFTGYDRFCWFVLGRFCNKKPFGKK